MKIEEMVEGDNAIIKYCSNYRLLEHGFVPNTPFEIYKKYGDLFVINIRGGLIASRIENLKEVYIEKKAKDL
jgi:Fe2+ transport system protein FeoA